MTRRTDLKKVFLSSTAEDLQDHRAKVTDAVTALQHLVVRMETFSAEARAPVPVCLQRISETDAVIAIVAHRYGWVPSEGQGGDGTKSITRIEVEAALVRRIPVFAFLVDDNYPWIQQKEQDRLLDPRVNTDPAKIVTIGDAVRRLAEFKEWLLSEAGLTTRRFTTPDHLAKEVAVSLANWARAEMASLTPRLAYLGQRDVQKEQQLNQLHEFASLVPFRLTIDEAEPLLREYARLLDLESSAFAEFLSVLEYRRHDSSGVPFASHQSKPFKLDEDRTSKRVRVVLSSARANEVSLILAEGGAVFTRHVLHGLSGRASRQDRVTIQSLFAYVSRQMTEEDASRPELHFSGATDDITLTAAARAWPADRRRVGLLLATEQYADRHLSQLPGVEAQIQDVATLLEKNGGFKCYQVRGADLTHITVTSVLDNIIADLRPEDLFVFYFIGLAGFDRERVYSLLLSDSDMSSNRGLPLQQISRALNGVQQVVLVLDTSFSAAAVAEFQ
jgi:hypothetical protein